MNLPFNFDRAIDGLTKVTLKGGAVGKIAFSVCVISIALAFVAWSFKDIWLARAVAAAIFVLAFTMLWRLINFADRHPQAALLEGAEFLVHEQIVHASKSMPTIPVAQTHPAQPEPIEGSAASEAIAQQPDVVDVDVVVQPGGQH